MNLYFRLLLLLLKLPFVQRRGLLDPSCVHFRVMPNDCDINWHMNNGRYLTFLDLGRLHLLKQSGLLSLIMKRRWMPVLAAAEINFIRPLAPFTRFSIVTRLVTWDEKYFYIEQRFERAGVLHAVSFVKGVFLSRGSTVPSPQVVDALGVHLEPPEMPAAVRHWTHMTDLKKQHIGAAVKQVARSRR